jgi:hypothetical protein
VNQRGLGGFPHERLENPKGNRKISCVINSVSLLVTVVVSVME